MVKAFQRFDVADLVSREVHVAEVLVPRHRRDVPQVLIAKLEVREREACAIHGPR
jgi:hypothetical protein